MIYRIRAAWEAFCDPYLVGEAKSWRRTLDNLHPNSGEFALLSAEIYQGMAVPKIEMLTYKLREDIRRYLRGGF